MLPPWPQPGAVNIQYYRHSLAPALPSTSDVNFGFISRELEELQFGSLRNGVSLRNGNLLNGSLQEGKLRGLTYCVGTKMGVNLRLGISRAWNLYEKICQHITVVSWAAACTPRVHSPGYIQGSDTSTAYCVS